jgi:membrane associated rhomboid family serine protease
VTLDCCVECRGIWCDGKELEHVLGTPLPLEARDSPSALAPAKASVRCPRGHGRLRQVSPGEGVFLDWCARCFGVWVDHGEMRQIRRLLVPTGWAPDERIEALDAQVEEAQRAADERTIEVVEAEAWSHKRHWIFQFLFGLPLEVYNPVRNRPLVTYALIALNVLIFLVQLSSPDLLTGQFALVPAALLQGGRPWTMLTSMVMHGGFLHLFGNMYFLGIFGDNVEDRLGAGQYLALYVIGGLAASLAHIASDPASTIPVIGASGAVSAVLGAYVYLFPHRRLYMMIFFTLQRVRAIWYLGIWLAMQVIFAATGAPGVAWWAHIGGFVAGAVAAAGHRALLRRRLAAAQEA